MAVHSHRNTPGHTIGTSIISKDDGRPAQEDDHTPGQTAVGFSNMSVRPAKNGGFEVSHTPVPKTQTPKGDTGAHEPIGHPETPVEEQLHVFRSATETHRHIGQLLGVRMGSGAQEI